MVPLVPEFPGAWIASGWVEKRIERMYFAQAFATPNAKSMYSFHII